MKKTKAMLFGTKNMLKKAGFCGIDLENESLHYVIVLLNRTCIF